MHLTVKKARSVIVAAVTGAVGLVAAVTAGAPAKAAELILMEQEGCAWCMRWEAEIGEIYPKTWEAKVAPLRKVDIHDPWPEDLKDIKPDFYTPTFVLVENGKEIGRLRGYAGDEFFWFLLDEVFEKLPEGAINEAKSG